MQRPGPWTLGSRDHRKQAEPVLQAVLEAQCKQTPLGHRKGHTRLTSRPGTKHLRGPRDYGVSLRSGRQDTPPRLVISKLRDSPLKGAGQFWVLAHGPNSLKRHCHASARSTRESHEDKPGDQKPRVAARLCRQEPKSLPSGCKLQSTPPRVATLPGGTVTHPRTLTPGTLPGPQPRLSGSSLEVSDGAENL